MTAACMAPRLLSQSTTSSSVSSRWRGAGPGVGSCERAQHQARAKGQAERQPESERKAKNEESVLVGGFCPSRTPRTPVFVKVTGGPDPPSWRNSTRPARPPCPLRVRDEHRTAHWPGGCRCTLRGHLCPWSHRPPLTRTSPPTAGGLRWLWPGRRGVCRPSHLREQGGAPMVGVRRADGPESEKAGTSPDE